MIEFLPPRDGAFGSGEEVDFVGFDGDDDRGFDDEPPRSRWLTALAVVGVTGLLAGGVIAAAPWDGDEVSTPPTTVPAPTTTVPRPTTTDAPEPTLPRGVETDPPGMLLTGTSPYQLAGAQSAGDFFIPGGDPVEVWMSPDAARTSGRWVVIDSRAQMSGIENLRRGAVRIDVGGRTALMSVASDGVVEVELPPTDGVGFAIATFGLDLTQIARIAGTLVIDARGIDHGDLLDPGGPFDGLDLRVAEDLDWYPGSGVLGAPETWSYFVDTATGRWVQVVTDRPTPTEQLLTDLVNQIPIDVATLDPDELAGLAALTEQVADPATVHITTDGREALYRIVRFALEDGQVVTVAGLADLDDLLEVSAQLELATPDAWRDAAIETTNGPGLEFDSGPVTEIGEGDDGAGRWTAQVDRIWFSIGANDYYFSIPFEPVSGPTVTAYRSLEHAFLLVTNTWPNEGLRVVVEQPGLEAQEANLRQVGDTPVYALALEIDGGLPLTISWVDLDGTPLDGPTSVP